METRVIGGYAYVRLADAAGMLGVCTGWARALTKRERLLGERVGRGTLVRLETVEEYRAKQDYWREMGGKWTATGRRKKLAPGERLRPKPVGPIECGMRDAECGIGGREVAGGQMWVPAGKAAGWLGVKRARMLQLAEQRGWERRKEREPAEALVRGTRRTQVWFRLEAVMREVEAREQGGPRSYTTAQRGNDLMKPFIRPTSELPEGDRLISVKEAAAILDIAAVTVRHHVRTGRLFGFRDAPGKMGVKVWLSENQVTHHRDRWDRARRHRAWKKRFEPKPTGKVPQTGWDVWRCEEGLDFYESGTCQGRVE